MIELPECAICGKPVERMYAWDDVLRAARYIAVFCHGQEERVELTRMLLEDCGGTMRFGKAFAAPQLPEATHV